MTNLKRLIAICGHKARLSVRDPDADDDAGSNYRQIARILAVLEAVRAECDFGPLRELNEGRPDVLCLDFTGPAATLRALAELLEGDT